jgi:signal transduction histidine kinase
LHELENAVRLREDLLAVVSHDLRSPLAAINLAASLLARRGASLNESRVRQQLETILRAGRRMETLIESLLDMASIQAGRLSVKLEPSSVRELVDEAVEFHAPLARAKAIELTAGSVVDAEVCCDRDRIQQVLANLLGNAIKFCGGGDSIAVSAEPLADAVRVSVADSGPGIPPEAQAHIFKPYWSAREHERKGTGLGLFISQGIVRAHGGELWVESVVGGGSTFYFTLPYPAESSPPA